jgi:DNA-directed RNA polymerase subunit RPC12/RpoP
MAICSRCGKETELYYSGDPVCIDCSAAIEATSDVPIKRKSVASERLEKDLKIGSENFHG